MKSDIPNTYRFFVAPEAIQSDSVTLTDPDVVHQMVRVLRLRPGACILLLDGQGNACTVRLSQVDRHAVYGQVEQRAAADGEPSISITLYVALLRPERFEWVLQKGTELGVSAFVPVHMARSLPPERAEGRKLARWHAIVREAAEQSCRGRVPILHEPQPFEGACAQAASATLPLLLWEGACQPLRTVLRAYQPPLAPPPPPPPSTLALISGPEGGITAEELTTAAAHGIIPISLGPRILRAETAPIAAVSAILYELEG